ncbi:MAG TPA: hypothetical protein VHT27_10720 [Solirubrobacteraceae bacterium]|jgi:hypothetical protein|nr:hypothetical protein [Solirubrobacteraceae bacterium]
MYPRAALLLLATVVASVLPASGAAAASSASTQAYLRADLQLASASAGRIPAGESILRNLVAQIRRECPGAAAKSPQDAQSTQLSDELIGAMVTSAIRPVRAAIGSFAGAVGGLRWSSGRVTRPVHAYVSQLRTMASLPVPGVCADVRSWAASGFTALPAATVSFDGRFSSSWVAVAMQPVGLTALEGGGERSLARLAAAREAQLADFEAREVETWGTLMGVLGLNP